MIDGSTAWRGTFFVLTDIIRKPVTRGVGDVWLKVSKHISNNKDKDVPANGEETLPIVIAVLMLN